MGNNASAQSVEDVREQASSSSCHQIPKVGKGSDWVDAAGDSANNGWGSSHGSIGNTAQGWMDKPAEARFNGWGESAPDSDENSKRFSSSKPPPPEVGGNGWMDEQTRGEYNGWMNEPAKQEFNGWMNEPVNDEYNGWGDLQPNPTSNPVVVDQINDPFEDTRTLDTSFNSFIHQNPDNSTLAPSAPPLPEEFLHEEIGHPPLEVSHASSSFTSGMHEALRISETTENNGSSSCIICWESPVEGACVPCGHMAGCMSCLNVIKHKKGVCPVCRVKIDQIIRLYAV